MYNTEMQTIENTTTTPEIPVSAIGNAKIDRYRPFKDFGYCRCGGCCCCKPGDDGLNILYDNTASEINDFGGDAADATTEYRIDLDV